MWTPFVIDRCMFLIPGGRVPQAHLLASAADVWCFWSRLEPTLVPLVREWERT
ncbi:hypothetical protein FOTG_15133 [Fusarium oxysporum f. sp. vasinfectum 25433]|uniref:Uncharacterized protein n=1 Tax=Fusarium oxysporum f. sp. vasinfectum 25433 TaxID=1089449 RepID=X0M7J5_FUSOX|nr:hypothetical protein FOTG_15133 [Fusarium oxysporum f. sp. vasinfectum 25433]